MCPVSRPPRPRPGSPEGTALPGKRACFLLSRRSTCHAAAVRVFSIWRPARVRDELSDMFSKRELEMCPVNRTRFCLVVPLSFYTELISPAPPTRIGSFGPAILSERTRRLGGSGSVHRSPTLHPLLLRRALGQDPDQALLMTAPIRRRLFDSGRRVKRALPFEGALGAGRNERASACRD
ncbi:hypothetical protein AAFF_G00073800 [Aldrovandia affinis]|uniref:Uncharacterized protein n=1 Tax=Aldrovandia affinis TaxID=143900 RepID=A0AAD7WCZ3_9TELE|nr:hypothetical protein AAFF_G00073800 [Aldrovandia affinis]